MPAIRTALTKGTSTIAPAPTTLSPVAAKVASILNDTIFNCSITLFPFH